MTTLNEVIQLVDRLSPQDRHRLRDYIDERKISAPLTETLDVEGLLDALVEIREGMTPEEFAIIEKAMND